MEERNLTCIGCPLGCALKVTINGENVTVTGNTCKRGTFIYKPGISVTKQDFHLQRGSLVLQMGFSAYYLPKHNNLLNCNPRFHTRYLG